MERTAKSRVPWNKGRKRFYECIYYTYDFDDWGRYHVCAKPIGAVKECKFCGIVARQHCPDFKKNYKDFSVVKP